MKITIEYDPNDPESVERAKQHVQQDYTNLTEDNEKSDDTETEKRVDDSLTEKERYVLGALKAHPGGAALRVIHRTVDGMDETPIEGYQDGRDQSGWTEERQEVGDILSRLKQYGYARREKQTWYPEPTATEIQTPSANV